MNESAQPDQSVQSIRPLVAITSDLMIRNDRPTAYLTMTYAQAVLDAGAIPVILPPMPMDSASSHADSDYIADLVLRFDAFILSGGDDPKTEPFGTPTHAAITPVLDARQSFETQLIHALADSPQTPVLGICLGMQMLALCNGGKLNQHLPDTHQAHETHWGHNHSIKSLDEASLVSGSVYSKHRQAVSDPGTLRVLAVADYGVIEAIDDPSRAFTLGVQWHPERTEDSNLGQGVINALVEAVF